MSKVFLFIAKVTIAAITALLFASCDMGSKLEGSGNITTQNRQIAEEFKSVMGGNGIEIIIEQGNGRAVKVEADDNLQEHIKTEVKNGELEIVSEENFSTGSTTRVYITMPRIEKLEATSSSRIISKSPFKEDKIELSANSGGNLDVTVTASDLVLGSSSGGKLKVNGKADNLQADSNSGGHINAKGLIANSVNAEASSGGEVYVNPVESLTADASTGGNIYYTNTPEKLKRKRSSGGNVEQD